MKLDIGYSKINKTKNVSHYFQLTLIISLLGFGLLDAHDVKTGGHKSPSKSPPTKSPPTKSSPNKKPPKQTVLQSQKPHSTTTTTTASLPKNPQPKSPPAQKPPSPPDLDWGMFLKIIKTFLQTINYFGQIQSYSGIWTRHFVCLFRWLGQLMSV